MQSIFHIDCDAFYASCEILRNPQFNNMPLAVGGLSNKSILTTANYKAREYGLHSAMPVFMAKKLCPDLILLPVDHKYYREISAKVFAIVASFTDTIEQVSIDEAYIIVNDENPLDEARLIQKEVFDKVGIGISIGISYNKFLAKLSSDYKKPMGITWIKKEDFPKYLNHLPINKVHGIGSKSSEKLNKFGIYTVNDLLKLDKQFLVDNFGKQGSYIYDVIRGVDNRKVNSSSIRKSIGKERTFLENTSDVDILNKYIREISESLEIILDNKNIMAKTINIKLKDENFKSMTRSITLQEPIYKQKDIYDEASILLDQIKKDIPFRLIGISLSNLSEKDLNQLSFLD